MGGTAVEMGLVKEEKKSKKQSKEEKKPKESSKGEKEDKLDPKVKDIEDFIRENNLSGTATTIESDNFAESNEPDQTVVIMNHYKAMDPRYRLLMRKITKRRILEMRAALDKFIAHLMVRRQKAKIWLLTGSLMMITLLHLIVFIFYYVYAIWSEK